MFFDRFEALCKQRGISKQKACIDCRLSRTAWNKWKAGAIPNGDAVQSLADYFGVTADYLLTGDETQKAPADDGEREITMDDFTYAMHNESGDLTDDDKAWLLSMARRIADDNRKRTQKPD